jgi:hypothetical protein
MPDEPSWYRRWWLWAAIVLALVIVFFPGLC